MKRKKRKGEEREEKEEKEDILKVESGKWKENNNGAKRYGKYEHGDRSTTALGRYLLVEPGFITRIRATTYIYT